jgi:hypothetical protein
MLANWVKMCFVGHAMRKRSGNMLFKVRRIGKIDMTITESLSEYMLTKELYDCEYESDIEEDED